MFHFEHPAQGVDGYYTRMAESLDALVAETRAQLRSARRETPESPMSTEIWLRKVHDHLTAALMAAHDLRRIASISDPPRRVFEPGPTS